MVIVFFLIVSLASFFLGLGLRLRGRHWLRAWIAAASVIPVSIFIVNLLEQAGRHALVVALIFGALCGIVLGGFGVLIGWLIDRKRRSNGAC